MPHPAALCESHSKLPQPAVLGIGPESDCPSDHRALSCSGKHALTKLRVRHKGAGHVEVSGAQDPLRETEQFISHCVTPCLWPEKTAVRPLLWRQSRASGHRYCQNCWAAATFSLPNFQPGQRNSFSEPPNQMRAPLGRGLLPHRACDKELRSCGVAGLRLPSVAFDSPGQTEPASFRGPDAAGNPPGTREPPSARP